MSPTLKRYLITAGLAALVVVVGFIVSRAPGPGGAKPGPGPVPAAGEASEAAGPATASAETPSTDASTAPPAVTTPAPTPAPATPAAAAPAVAATRGLAARVPLGMSAPSGPTSIGSLDPKIAPWRITFATSGAGIAEIVFSDYWLSVEAATAARRAAAGAEGVAMPPDADRFVLARATDLAGYVVPVLAARAVEIDGEQVNLFGQTWAEAAPGAFITEIVDPSGAVVARLERAFAVGADAHDLVVAQRFTNLTAAPMKVRWIQYGPSDLPFDPGALLEVRRFHFGYLFPPERDPSQAFVSANGQMLERSSVSAQITEGQPTLWPNRASTDGRLSLSWFGTTDRYFALAVHAPYAPPGSPSRALASVAEIRAVTNGIPAPGDFLFTTLWSPLVEVAPSAAASFDLGVFAGPLDPKLLGEAEPYASLHMAELVVYLMSGCCSWCTFPWLAKFLLWFLSFLHSYVVFDWALAIIALVIVVRVLLHPLQKKSQISMQRFSRAMSAMKPELDALQKRFKEDPARMQQEQMRLFKEKGVSPAGCVGGLVPTFAQMPIWTALYAMLFFAIDLRQQPAFFGLFQAFGGWSFLGDLSAPDRFIPFAQPFDLWFFRISSVNVLPVLLGIVFFLQQKYLAPPMPNATEEQLAQQRMMKWIMVLMFPIMTYPLPSGLTLYIFTSTCIGILESRRIKRQVDAMDLSKPLPKKPGFLSKVFEQALARAQERQQATVRRKFKDR